MKTYFHTSDRISLQLNTLISIIKIYVSKSMQQHEQTENLDSYLWANFTGNGRKDQSRLLKPSICWSIPTANVWSRLEISLPSFKNDAMCMFVNTSPDDVAELYGFWHVTGNTTLSTS